MKWFKWGISEIGGYPIIRRYRIVDGKREWQSYPKKKYADMSADEVQALIRRLNASYEAERLRAEARYDFDHGYINNRTLEEFEFNLRAKISSKEHVTALMSYLYDYILPFFIVTERLPDPNAWLKAENAFGAALLKQKLGSSSIKRIIQTANRYLAFLHKQFPDEIRLIKLEPFSEKVLLKADDSNSKKGREKFITPEQFELIISHLRKELVPAARLAYCFGLRRSEVLGLVADDVFEDFLRVERQLKNLGEVAPLKAGREAREIPYWFASAKDTYEMISHLVVVHPDTFGREFSKASGLAGMKFELHDLRRTFITRALRKYHYLDVKLAVGHTDLETTNKYLQDDRKLSRKKFIPT